MAKPLGALVDHDCTFVHPHSALKRQLACLGGGDLYVDGLVEREILLDFELLNSHLGGAGLIGPPGEPQRSYLILVQLDPAGLEATITG